jgi:hypothetical protein
MPTIPLKAKWIDNCVFSESCIATCEAINCYFSVWIIACNTTCWWLFCTELHLFLHQTPYFFVIIAKNTENLISLFSSEIRGDRAYWNKVHPWSKSPRLVHDCNHLNRSDPNLSWRFEFCPKKSVFIWISPMAVGTGKMIYQTKSTEFWGIFSKFFKNLNFGKKIV